MKYKLTTYKTIIGTKDVLEISKRKSGQWVIYQDNKPSYFVDCFDFKEESNLIINNWILSKGKSIDYVIKQIKKNKKVNLSLAKPPLFEIKVKTEEKELNLAPLPKEWIS